MMRSSRLALFILGLGAALLLGACGLETYLYLEAPGNYSSGQTLIFQHNTNNTDPSFLGYEVYYRIYPGNSPSIPPSQATTDIALISSKVSAGTGADQVIQYLANTKGFSRMSNQSTSPVTSPGSPPFTVIPSSLTGTTGVRTTMDLTNGQVTFTAPSSADQVYYCARSVMSSGGGYYLPFSDATYNAGDCESANFGNAEYFTNSTMNYPYVVVYAFAYALESDFTSTYSYPVLLNESGTATYNPPQSN